MYPNKNQRVSIGHKQDSDGKSKGDSIQRSSKRSKQFSGDEFQNESGITNSDSYCLDPKDQASYGQHLMTQDGQKIDQVDEQ